MIALDFDKSLIQLASSTPSTPATLSNATKSNVASTKSNVASILLPFLATMSNQRSTLLPKMPTMWKLQATELLRQCCFDIIAGVDRALLILSVSVALLAL